eukprot:TRINITY_DN11389_c0_g1_i1.p2 TRINITY_DN11389_c0_g1~~TRINITY_DN11389_c0_g1_i1.p2  ORF type:complete len:102 (+),score=28.48 TRINITY_DN11389_c0_g1_i1:91-396(+)
MGSTRVRPWTVPAPGGRRLCVRNPIFWGGNALMLGLFALLVTLTHSWHGMGWVAFYPVVIGIACFTLVVFIGGYHCDVPKGHSTCLDCGRCTSKDLRLPEW